MQDNYVSDTDTETVIYDDGKDDYAEPHTNLVKNKIKTIVEEYMQIHKRGKSWISNNCGEYRYKLKIKNIGIVKAIIDSASTINCIGDKFYKKNQHLFKKVKSTRSTLQTIRWYH